MRLLEGLLIDNYDSFTYNLYQALCTVPAKLKVVRNDKITLSAVERLAPDFIVVSPGPREPKHAGVSNEVIQRLGPVIPLLGVCLGHQSINEVFGGRTIRAEMPCHGKTTRIQHDGSGVFQGIPQGIEVARYHSLVADPATISPDLAVTAWTEEGIVMGLRHRRYPIEGVQFHPESFMTEYGVQMLKNFCSGGRCGIGT